MKITRRQLRRLIERTIPSGISQKDMWDTLFDKIYELHIEIERKEGNSPDSRLSSYKASMSRLPDDSADSRLQGAITMLDWIIKGYQAERLEQAKSQAN